jgi:phosphoribosyl 1,2-cyclic phosphodiesterase/anti-anti-sigma regulatory factor
MSTEQLQERLFRAVSDAHGVDLTNPAAVKAYIANLTPSVGQLVGGNTTCVEIDTGTHTIIIDAGSGIRPLGIHLMGRSFGKGKGEAHIFLTHAHWDHLQGFPFFVPAFVPGNLLHFYAVNYNPQQYLEHQQVAPMFFPVPTSVMAAQKEFHQLREGEPVMIGNVKVTSLALYHPGTAYAYRFEDGESVFVFASDAEYKSLSEHSLKRYVDFFADADVLVFDAQYSLRDVFFSRADWGHSSAIIGVDIAERARVKKLITFHHEPTHSDEQIHQIAQTAREYALVNNLSFQTEVIVGREGLEVHLGKAPKLEVNERREEPMWTMSLNGYLENAITASVQHQLEALLIEAPNGRAVLDLTHLKNIDANGVKAVLDAARARPKTQMAVVAPAAHIYRTLEQSNSPAVVALYQNYQQAITALRGPEHLHLATSVIGGQFHIDHLWFADDVGVIYAGEDRASHVPVLVRVVAGQPDDPTRAEFLRQLHNWQQLQDPALLPLTSHINQDGWLAGVCAQPEGLSLREWRARKPRWREIWAVAEQLSQAVAAAHTNNTIHGALRPEKVVVQGGHLQLGCMPLFPHPAGFGPEAYRAPEQLHGQTPTLRTDVYVLGLMLYELILGKPPFTTDEDDNLRLTLQLYSEPQHPRALWPEIPEALENLLLQMLAVKPEERPASGLAVVEAIHHLDSGTLLLDNGASRRGTGPLAHNGAQAEDL